MRVLLLVLSLAVLLYLALETKLYATSVLLVALTAYQVWSLLSFVDRTNLSLSRFFDSIRYGDFLQTHSAGQFGGSFADLSRAMDQVSSAFHTARASKEEHYRYLQTVVDHVGVGLLAFDEAGSIALINPAAKRLLQLPHLRSLTALRDSSPQLVDTLAQIQPGQKALVKLTTAYEPQQLTVHATKIRLGGRALTLVSLQNIGSELAEQEMAAWQNLIRVLTHEIMNSMTPIASLAGSVGTAVRRRSREDNAAANSTDEICDALATIERRSQGLLHFVESYRDLTRIPRPEIRVVKIADMVSRVEQLMEASSEARPELARTILITPENLEVACDPDLIEQVLINLYGNAVHALREVPEPCVEIRAGINREGRVAIEVSDNGPGILPEVSDMIFVPFFTTKKGGTGIGLALSRQIMRLHDGHITVRSVPHQATTFTLTF